MSTFIKGGGARTPFGRNEFLRSKENVKTESYTLDMTSVPAVTIDGFAGQKVLQPGTVLAKITGGPQIGKVGPFQAGGTQAAQTLTKSGTITSGTFTLSFGGQVTPAIDPIAETAASVQAKLQALSTIGAGNVLVTGGPVGTGPFTVTFTFAEGAPESLLVVNNAAIVGGGTVVAASTVTGVAGATDGRQTLANIVGLCQTFLPWTLTVRDVEVAAVYEAAVVQGWCFEMDINQNFIPLSNTTAAAMQRGGAAGKLVDLSFR